VHLKHPLFIKDDAAGVSPIG